MDGASAGLGTDLDGVGREGVFALHAGLQHAGLRSGCVRLLVLDAILLQRSAASLAVLLPSSAAVRKHNNTGSLLVAAGCCFRQQRGDGVFILVFETLEQ